MEFFHLVKASQKSGKPNGVFWFTAKTEARAKLQAQVILEDNGIEVGRGQDYQLPVLTNFPVVDDLPEEEVIDFTWCDRYTLGEDGRTWLPVVKPVESRSEGTADTSNTAELDDEALAKKTLAEFRDREMPVLVSVCTLPFRQRIVAQLLADKDYAYHIDTEQKKELLATEMDTDNTYVQNLILAAENEPSLKELKELDLWKMTSAVKSVFPIEAKAPELGTLCQLIKAWIDTPYLDRGLLVKEWQSGKRVTSIQRTDKGTNAGGGIKTDRPADYVHTLDTLDTEIAAALQPDNFDIYNIPGSIYRHAKEIVTKKESPFKEWSVALRSSAGILDYSRAAIFALIRSADKGVHQSPASLQTYITTSLVEYQHDKPSTETVAAAQNCAAVEVPTNDEVNKLLAAGRGEYIEGVSDPADPKWGKTPRKSFCTHEENLQRVREEGARRRAEEAALQPKIEKLGAGIYSVESLLTSPSNEVIKQEAEIVSNVQMEETIQVENKVDSTLPASENADAAGSQTDSVNNVVCMSCGAIGGGHCPDCGSVVDDVNQNHDSSAQNAPDVNHSEPDISEIEPDEKPSWPEYFEPGRYEGVPNDVYHAANGISSTMVKDARVSLMYFKARHVSKTIQKVRSPVLDMGNLVHALALQPDLLYQEFSIEPEIPEGAFTTTATIRAAIDAYNATLPPLLSADDIKSLIEQYNATLPPQVALGSSLEETGQSYMALPAEFQRIEEGQKQTAAAMKACIKEYNATLPPQVKTSGSRDALLEQLAIINPDLVAQEAQKAQPLKVSGTKTDLIQSLKAVTPDAVFADELLDAWRENPEGKVLVTRQQLSTAQAIQKALLDHPTAGKLLTHQSRAVEVSYFGIDEETGLDIRVRPDLEIDMGSRIGADLKTISMWNIKQEGLRAKLHREIIERDYHLSAAMYCETAALDQFFWIFVNKDENYHWIAIIEASAELLELGMLEYRKAMKNIAYGFDTGEWPAPITEDYSEELNDFDVRRLEALRGQA